MNKKRRYWINTSGNMRILYTLVRLEPANAILLMYDLKECGWFTYFLYEKTAINLLAHDKFKWLKAKLGV